MADERHKTEDMTGSGEGGTDMPPSEGAGEDESSAPKEGDDRHLHENQKPTDK